MVKVSVIVPVYNMEKYIVSCLDSIVKQSYSTIEIIIVNDGSKDHSKQLIQEYMKQYPEKEIKYVEKENGGLSDARNFGVLHATGEYISFVDADDTISLELYETLLPYMKAKDDLIKFKLQTIAEDGTLLQKIEGPIFEHEKGEEAFHKLYANDVMTEVSCIYLYRTEFYRKQHHFEFTKGSYHEDFGLIPYVILKAKSVSSVDYVGYHYLQTDFSITREKDQEKNKKRAWDLLLHYDNLQERLQKDEEISTSAKDEIKRYYTNAILLKTMTLTKPEQEDYIQEIKKRNLLRNIKVTNLKQFIKKILLTLNLRWYLAWKNKGEKNAKG